MDLASVTVEDDDIPPAPTGLRANGDLTNEGDVTLSWDAVPGATSYNIRYVEEVCLNDMGCDPDGGSANPKWKKSASAVMASEDNVQETSFSGLTEKTLYRIETQAVNTDREESDWSDFTFVFPTSGPLTAETTVALMPIKGFQADGLNAGSFRYTICIDDPMTVPNPMNSAISGSWTIAEIIAEIKNAAETWETAVGDSRILSTTADPETSLANCEDPEFPSTHNQIQFLGDNKMNMVCRSTLAIGCWRNTGGDLPSGQEMDKRSIAMRASGGPIVWDTTVNGCSLLHSILAHEVGHAFGIDHPELKTVRRTMYLMHRKIPAVCEPQPYDVAAAMANYQSR